MAAAAEAPTPKSASVEKEDNLTYCLAHLAAFDISPLHPKADLLATTRDNVQLLVNKVFGLSREDSDEGPAAIIPPEESFRLPRQRPIPKVKELTRWEKFMKERKMDKKKRSSMVFDEASGDWKRRWGFKSVKHTEDEGNGILEVKTGQDSYKSLFEAKSAEHQLGAAKQKMREVRNRVEAAGGRLKAAAPDLDAGMRSGQESTKRGAAGLKEALRRAQSSSASCGRFDRVASNEPTNLQPKKRKAPEMPKNLKVEKDRGLQFADKVLSGATVDHKKMVGAGRAAERNKDGRIEKKNKGKRSKAGGKSSRKKGGR